MTYNNQRVSGVLGRYRNWNMSKNALFS